MDLTPGTEIAVVPGRKEVAMKRILALLVLSAVVITAALVVVAAARPPRTVGECYDNWEACRIEALSRDASVIQTTLMLTVCDIALGRCIIYG